MEKTTRPDHSTVFFKGAIYTAFSFLFFLSTALQAKSDKLMNVQPLPDITISCDLWFPFNPNDPNSNINDFDNIFGKILVGTTSGRDSINIVDRVCPNHPRFSEFAPSNPGNDPCYDDFYRIYWGKDGYVIGYGNVPLEQIIENNLHCGQGEIVRKWRQYGSSQFITEQKITIINCKEFYVPTDCWRFTAQDVGTCDFVSGAYLTKLIEWPCDVEIQNCQGQGNDIFDPDNLPVAFEQDRRPRLDDDHCSLMASTYEDTVFPAVDSVCVKVFRNWKVIDWCLYEQSINGTYSGPYQWSHLQVIKMLNTDTPDFANCNDTTFCGYGPGCEGAVEIRPGISDDCTPADQLRIDYKIDLGNDGSFDLLGYSDNQAGYPFPNPANLPVSAFDATSPQADGTYPLGTHRILWAAEDGCGNINVCGYNFTIEDCKPPTAYCQIGISTIAMHPEAGGYVDVWASDFDLGSSDNCTAAEDLRFSFSTDVNDRVVRLTCADAVGQIDYTIHIWDEAGNYSTCLVAVIVNDCSGNSNNFITVEDTRGRVIADMQLRITGPNGEEAIVRMLSGRIDPADISLVNFPGPYKIEPYNNIDFRNGVTTFDMILMSKHILDIQALDSPYKILAADVNNGETLTTFDMVDMRRLILFLTTEFPNNTTSWKFADANFDFPDPANPLGVDYPYFITTNRLDSLFGSFIGFKMGDVNESATGLTQEESEDRSGPTTFFAVEDQKLKAGETYSVDLKINTKNDLLGLQFSLQIDPEAAEMIGWKTGSIDELDAGNLNTTMSDRGLVLGSWSSASSHQIDEQTFITITLRAKQNVRLSDILSLSTEYLAAEAYSEGRGSSPAIIHDLQIRFAPAKAAAREFELLGNDPNPFKEQTTIRFYQPQSSLVSLQVFDALGRQVFETRATYEAGTQQIVLNNTDLRNPGLYYYRIAFDDQLEEQGSVLLLRN